MRAITRSMLVRGGAYLVGVHCHRRCQVGVKILGTELSHTRVRDNQRRPGQDHQRLGLPDVDHIGPFTLESRRQSQVHTQGHHARTKNGGAVTTLTDSADEGRNSLRINPCREQRASVHADRGQFSSPLEAVEEPESAFI